MIRVTPQPAHSDPPRQTAGAGARRAAPAAALFSGPAVRPTLASLSTSPATGMISRGATPRVGAAAFARSAVAAPESALVSAPVSAVIQRFQAGNLHFSSKEEPNQAVPGSIYFQAGAGDQAGRIRLGHPHGPAVERDAVGDVRHRLSEGANAAANQDVAHAALAQARSGRRQARRANPAAPAAADQILRNAVAAHARPVDVDQPGRLLEYTENAAGRITSTHPSRGSPVTEAGVQNQAHLDRIIQAADAGRASIDGAGNRVSRGLKTWWHNKNVNSTYLSPPGTSRWRRMKNWLRA